jgi:hypothetical protein
MILSQKLLTRYRDLKQDVPDCLLLMQVGTFMQVMDQDRACACRPSYPAAGDWRPVVPVSCGSAMLGEVDG